MNCSENTGHTDPTDLICWLDDETEVCKIAASANTETAEYWKGCLRALAKVRGYMEDRLKSRLDIHIPCKNSTMIISVENDGDAVSTSVGCCLPDGTDFYFSTIAANLLSGTIRADLIDPVSEEILETTALTAAAMLSNSEYSKTEQQSDGT